MIRHFPWVAVIAMTILGLIFWPFLLLFAFFMLIVAVAATLSGRRR